MSLDRLTQFLQNTELLDVYTPESGSNVIGLQNPARDSIGLKNARFTWDRNAKDEDSVASSTRKFCLRIEDELVFEQVWVVDDRVTVRARAHGVLEHLFVDAYT